MKKLLAMLLASAMIVTAFAGCNSNDSETSETNSSEASTAVYEYEVRDLPAPVYITPAESFAGGTGTEADPFQISSAEELAFLEQVINDPDKALNNEYDNAYYILTKDISLNDTSDFENWAEKGPEFSWEPIDDTQFKGNFDGNGHTISGMYINTNCEKSMSDFGLFGGMAGTISNLILDKSYVAVSGQSANVGGLVGYLFKGDIENCTSNVVMDCYNGTYGGLVGVSAGNITSNSEEIELPGISNCIFDGVINQKKENTMNYIGGVVGSGEGNIRNCSNNGTINFNADNVAAAGGIIAYYTEGELTDCKNKGTLNGAFSDDNTFVEAGGIVGNLMVTSTGSEKYMSRGVTVKNCENIGKVSANYAAGGIVGNVSNDHNDWCLTISNCTNSGQVKASTYTGGVIGKMYCIGDAENGENIVVENCTNTADINQGTSGGVIGYFESENGKAVISNCKNEGDITSNKEQNAGGIIAYWLMDSNPDVQVSIDGCVNDGKVSSTLHSGGIFGFVDAPVLLEDVKSTTITVKNCVNNGQVEINEDNGYIGGIAGCWGMKTVPTTIENCMNNGSLSINNDQPDNETINSGKVMTLSRIAGGIIGRAGEGLLLTTDNDKGDANNIQKANAVIKLIGCQNKGSLNVAVNEEFTNSNGEKIYENYFGGIIGNATAEDEFSIFVDNCKYTNFDRGLGNTDYPDIGTKE